MKTIYSCFCLAIFLVNAQTALASTVYNEVDAGLNGNGFYETAENITQLPVQQINASISWEYDIDIFRFSWGGGYFSVVTGSVTNPSVNPVLYLLDSNGYGIAANDDYVGGGSKIDLTNLISGDYLLIMSPYAGPVTSNFQLMFPSFIDGTNVYPTNPNEPWLKNWWAYIYQYTDPLPSTSGNYSIYFASSPTVATVPEASTTAMIGAGVTLIGLASIRRKYQLK